MAVPKFEEFKAPWETDAQGNPIAEDAQVIDKAQLKKWAHALLTDKEKAQVARDTERSKNTELTTKYNELEAKLTGAGANTGGEGKENDQIKQLMGLVTKLTEDNKKAVFDSQKITILTSKGFDPVADMALFDGKNTAEAVEQYAELLTERGLGGKKEAPTGNENNNGGNGQPVLDGRPPAQLNNGLPNGGADEKVDVEAFLKQYSTGNPL